MVVKRELRPDTSNLIQDRVSRTGQVNGTGRECAA